MKLVNVTNSCPQSILNIKALLKMGDFSKLAISVREGHREYCNHYYLNVVKFGFYLP